MALGWQILVILLSVAVLALGFLLLGLMRRVEVLSWQLSNIRTTTPRRKGRDGLKPGSKAPNFTLPSMAGNEISLHDFAGQKVLLVFTQDGCGPCHAVLPELNRPFREPMQVLVVNNGVREKMEQALKAHPVNYPVLLQQSLTVSKKYEVLATPFAFLVDEEGRVAAAGVVNSHEHVNFLLDAAAQRAKQPHDESPEAIVVDRPESESRETSAEPVAAES